MIVETYEVKNKDMGQIIGWLSEQSFSSYYVKCESEGDFVYIFFKQTLAGVDKEALDFYLENYKEDSFLHEINVTEKRNEEGFLLYKKIFSHISDSYPIESIDVFLEVYPVLMTFRCLLKDGQGESALRYMKRVLEPLHLYEDFDLYKGWVRSFCIKYNANLDQSSLDYIENADNGEI